MRPSQSELLINSILRPNTVEPLRGRPAQGLGKESKSNSAALLEAKKVEFEIPEPTKRGKEYIRAQFNHGVSS